jgi:hypothetical protein
VRSATLLWQSSRQQIDAALLVLRLFVGSC